MIVWIGYDSKTDSYDYMSTDYDKCKRNCDNWNNEYKHLGFNFVPKKFKMVEE